MGITRDFFKKIRDTKGIVHAKMSLKKDRNFMDLTEAEDIKKRQQKSIQKRLKNGTENIFMIQIIMMV